MKIDRFVLLEPLGQGGMGVVYAAYDPQLCADAELLRRAYPPPSPPQVDLVAALERELESVTNLANLADAREDFETAAAHHERALAIKREALGERAPGTGVALLNLGMSEPRLGRWSSAYGHDREAVEILTEARG